MDNLIFFASPVILVFFEGKEYIRKSKYVSVPEIEKRNP